MSDQHAPVYGRDRQRRQGCRAASDRKSTTDYGLPTGIYYPHKSAQLIDEKTAGTIADMMHNNVIETYGQDRFPGMDICAKSGTAEVGADKSPNAWFTGFLRDEATPYASSFSSRTAAAARRLPVRWLRRCCRLR